MMLSLTVNWLDHAKTLREQGVESEETLLLRRKFFFSDQNVDARDPVQLNLLFVQVGTIFQFSYYHSSKQNIIVLRHFTICKPKYASLVFVILSVVNYPQKKQQQCNMLFFAQDHLYNMFYQSDSELNQM